MKHRIPDFHERLSVRDRITVDALSKWARQIHWEWFVSLTFPWPVRPETAQMKLRRYIDSIERHHGARVCVIAGQESKARQAGMSVPTHFHVLITSFVPLSKEALESLWFAHVTRNQSQDRDVESIRVEPYQNHERGPEYCLKSINIGLNEWHIHRFGDFHPKAPGNTRPNHKSIRNARRHEEQRARRTISPTPKASEGKRHRLNIASVGFGLATGL